MRKLRNSNGRTWNTAKNIEKHTVSWTNNVVLCESDTYFYGQNGTSSYYANPSGTVTIVCVRY